MNPEIPEPLSLDPRSVEVNTFASLERIKAQLAAAEMAHDAMVRQLQELYERSVQAGLLLDPETLRRLEDARVIKIKSDLPPACMDSREGLAAFRAALPAVRIVFAHGSYPLVWKLAKLWLAYWLVAGVPSLDVMESWAAVRKAK